MSADTLRRAAGEMRRDFEGVNYTVQSDFMFAVADWLDSAYAEWRRRSLTAISVRVMWGDLNEPDPRALIVARTYLGEQS